jgi:hypothetical protein
MRFNSSRYFLYEQQLTLLRIENRCVFSSVSNLDSDPESIGPVGPDQQWKIRIRIRIQAGKNDLLTKKMKKFFKF